MNPLKAFRLLLLSLQKWKRDHPTATTFLLAFLIFKWLQRTFRRPMTFVGKVVLITGGASGIGRLVALRLKSLGCRVIIWDINDKGLQEMRSQVDVARCNITNRDEVMEEAQNIIRRFGRVDILINNAGIVSGKPMLDLAPEQIRLTFEVNAISHFWTIQAFLPGMQRQNWGQIVTIASSAGRTGIACLADYCGSKFAARGIEDAVRDEVIREGYHGIKFSVINPYFINTGMFKGAQGSKFFLLSGLFTMLDQDEVADEIVEAIRYRKREVILPFTLQCLVLFEHFYPLVLTDWMRTQASDMTQFVGRH